MREVSRSLILIVWLVTVTLIGLLGFVARAASQ
jgi:hypothetical protein